ncbi:MAG: hypothetical protein ABR907_09235 [Terracidiphilus sp.]
MVAGLALLLMTLVLAKKLEFFKRDLWVIGGFSAIIAAQTASTGFIGPLSLMGFYARLLVAFAVVRLMRDFARVFIETMFWTSVVSFPFFALMIVTHGRIVDLIAPISVNVPDPYLLVHFFASTHLTQNNSYFWEPGVFAGYLVLAIACLGAIKEQYSLKRYRFILLVLLVAVVTTQSTGGYLTVPLALIFHGKALGKNLGFRAVVILFAIVGGIILFQKVDFLGSKIKSQNEQIQGQGYSWQRTRLGSMIYDARLIRAYPLFGWGPDPDAANGVVDLTLASGEGNGLSNFTASFGFCGLALFLAATWSGFSSLYGGKKILPTLAVIVVVLILNDECFLNFPLFLTLMFLRKSSQKSFAPSIEAADVHSNASRVRGDASNCCQHFESSSLAAIKSGINRRECLL